MKHHPLPSLVMFCAFTVVAPCAWSQPAPTSSDTVGAQADDLDHRGVDLLKKHQWAQAEELFRQALALKRSYDIAGNLGLAEVGVGKWRDAAEHLSFALSTFPANGKPAHRDLLREKLNTAREHVAALTIEVNVAGAEVLIDGVSAGTSPLADNVFVEPGAHRVEAKHAGYADGVDVVQGAQGATLPVTLTLAPADPVPPARSGGTGGKGPATPPPPQVQGGPNKAVVISGAVVTGIGLGVGIGLVVAAQAKTSAADTALATLTMPGSTTLCQTSTCATINSDRQAHDALAKGAIGAFVTAGAIGVATLGYALLSPKGAQKAGARVVPIVGSTEAGVAITGAW